MFWGDQSRLPKERQGVPEVATETAEGAGDVEEEAAEGALVDAATALPRRGEDSHQPGETTHGQVHQEERVSWAC